jgi:hypothetical protein
MITIVTVSAPKAEKKRIDGKKSRQFVTIVGADLSDPTNVNSSTRNVWQKYTADGEPTWGVTSPERMKSLEGKTRLDYSIATEAVHPTKVEIDGVERIVRKKTMLLFALETKSEAAKKALFRSSGFPLVTDEPLASTVAEEEQPEIKAPADLHIAQA